MPWRYIILPIHQLLWYHGLPFCHQEKKSRQIKCSEKQAFDWWVNHLTNFHLWLCEWAFGIWTREIYLSMYKKLPNDLVVLVWNNLAILLLSDTRKKRSSNPYILTDCKYQTFVLFETKASIIKTKYKTDPYILKKRPTLIF